MVTAKCETLAVSIAMTAGSPVSWVAENAAAFKSVSDRCKTLGMVPSADVAEAAAAALMTVDSNVVAKISFQALRKGL